MKISISKIVIKQNLNACPSIWNYWRLLLQIRLSLRSQKILMFTKL